MGRTIYYLEVRLEDERLVDEDDVDDAEDEFLFLRAAAAEFG